MKLGLDMMRRKAKGIEDVSKDDILAAQEAEAEAEAAEMEELAAQEAEKEARE